MRKKSAKKRILIPDSKYNSQLVTRFVNNLMIAGKKNVAFKVFYNAMDLVEKKMEGKTELSPVDIFKQALENVTPAVEVKSRRVGGATFQVPAEIRPSRKTAIGMRNLILFSRAKKGKPMHVKLSEEIVSAFNKEGASFKKKEDIHRMAEANRAFAHFRF
jgi:small subunit ribosomal protein S7